MRGWIKAGLLAALVFGACWGGSVWYWRATNRMPAGADLALWLLALPLVLLFLFWLGRRLFALAAAAPAAAAAAAQTAAPAAPPASLPPLAIVAAALRSPRGASPQELAQAFADNLARAALDADLVDGDGFPVMTARSGDAGDAALQEDIMAWLAESGLPDLQFSEAQWRALAMATGVASDLAGAAASALVPDSGVAPLLQLVTLLPPDWPLDQRHAAAGWLRHTVAQFGWPAASIALAAGPLTDADPAALLGRLALSGGQDGAALVAMLIAGGSQLAQEDIDAWSDNGTLFTASRQQGLIPGEGAAGLLLTGLAQASASGGAAFTVLHAVSQGRRAASADDSRRTDATLLLALAEQALTGAAPAMIVADTGHRGNRVLELMAVAGAAAPQLDAAADVLCVGAAGGSCGAVPFITALAMAHHHALERAAPVLCISNEDPYHRCATLIGPAALAS